MGSGGKLMAITNGKKIEKISIAGHEIMVNSDRFIDLATPLSSKPNLIFRDLGDGTGRIYGGCTVPYNVAADNDELVINAPNGYKFTSVSYTCLVGHEMVLRDFYLFTNNGDIYFKKTSYSLDSNEVWKFLCTPSNNDTNNVNDAFLYVTYDKA